MNSARDKHKRPKNHKPAGPRPRPHANHKPAARPEHHRAPPHHHPRELTPLSMQTPTAPPPPHGSPPPPPPLRSEKSAVLDGDLDAPALSMWTGPTSITPPCEAGPADINRRRLSERQRTRF